MSKNLDLVRSIYADWERGDFSSTEWADPGIEFVVASGPNPGTSRGLAATSDMWRGWLDTWDAYRAEAEHLREVNDELALVRAYGHTGGSAGVVEDRSANVFAIRRGRVVRLALHADRNRALADLGLEE